MAIQSGADDCGAAALATLASLHGHPCSLATARRVVGPGEATLAALEGASRELGLDSYAVKVPAGLLGSLPLPAIAHVRGHWVVLLTVEGHMVELHDPARGPRTLRRGRFRRQWTGYALVVADDA
jgi:ABC-type bacteriocin/lantibiotic exporter with double-glycine peptidase domain